MDDKIEIVEKIKSIEYILERNEISIISSSRELSLAKTNIEQARKLLNETINIILETNARLKNSTPQNKKLITINSNYKKQLKEIIEDIAATQDVISYISTKEIKKIIDLKGMKYQIFLNLTAHTYIAISLAISYLNDEINENLL